NAGPIDVTDRASAGLRGARLSASGRQLHLVQFSGPVKPEWHAALEATGVRIVEYIPHNAYLVWGDARGLSKVSELASKSSFVQWDGAYLNDYKINPSVFAMDTERWQVQLVADAAANG